MEGVGGVATFCSRGTMGCGAEATGPELRGAGSSGGARTPFTTQNIITLFKGRLKRFQVLHWKRKCGGQTSLANRR